MKENSWLVMTQHKSILFYKMSLFYMCTMDIELHSDPSTRKTMHKANQYPSFCHFKSTAFIPPALINDCLNLTPRPKIPPHRAGGIRVDKVPLQQ